MVIFAMGPWNDHNKLCGRLWGFYWPANKVWIEIFVMQAQSKHNNCWEKVKKRFSNNHETHYPVEWLRCLLNIQILIFHGEKPNWNFLLEFQQKLWTNRNSEKSLQYQVLKLIGNGRKTKKENYFSPFFGYCNYQEKPTGGKSILFNGAENIANKREPQKPRWKLIIFESTIMRKAITRIMPTENAEGAYDVFVFSLAIFNSSLFRHFFACKSLFEWKAVSRKKHTQQAPSV